MRKKKISKKAAFRLLTYGFFSIIMIGYFLFVVITGTFRFLSLKTETNQLEKELSELKYEEKRLENEILKLHDPEYIASYARKHYQYSKDGELIIRINEPESLVEIEKESSGYSFVFGLIVLVFVLLVPKLFKKKS